MARKARIQGECEVWRHPLHQRPNARSIVTSEFLVLPEKRTRLVRLDPTTGATVWSARIHNPWGWLALGSDRIFYLNQHSHVQCYDDTGGLEQWSADLRGTCGWLVSTGPTLLVGGWRGYTPLVALDSASGEHRWSLDLAGRPIAEPVAGPWGVAVAYLAEPVLRFLDPASGEIVAEKPLPAHGQEPDASPLLRRHGDHLLLAGRDGRFHRLGSPSDSWTLVFRHSGGIGTSAPPVVGDDVLFVDVAGTLNCYELRSGSRRWSAPWQHRRSDLLPVARSSRELLAVGSDGGRLSVFGPTGDLLWSKVVGRRINTAVAWLDDRTLVAGTTGALLAIRPPLP